MKPANLCFVVAGAVLVLFLYSTSAHAATRPAASAICDQVAQIAARKTGVPVTVLQAITRTETGRKTDGRFGPWPWTVNMEGKGIWFDTLDEARAYVFREFKRGARSFDVGCFQINYKWHHQAFSSIDEMFDPVANATYAAEFLKSLYAEHGTWSDAAGAYHSRTPKHAERYKAVFERHRRNAPGAGSLDPILAATPQASPPAAPRINTFPLLQAAQQSGDSPVLGSLVPVGNRASSGGFLEIHSAAAARLIGG